VAEVITVVKATKLLVANFVAVRAEKLFTCNGLSQVQHISRECHIIKVQLPRGLGLLINATLATEKRRSRRVRNMGTTVSALNRKFIDVQPRLISSLNAWVGLGKILRRLEFLLAHQ
jgi:hypothetical protein